MITKETLISLAKEKGFSATLIQNIPYNTKAPWALNESMRYYLWMCELQRWLLKTYNIQTYVFSHTFRNGKYADFIAVVNNTALNDARDEEFQNPEEALEAGLLQALNLITE